VLKNIITKINLLRLQNKILNLKLSALTLHKNRTKIKKIKFKTDKYKNLNETDKRPNRQKMDCATVYNSFMAKMVTIGITDLLGIVLNLFNVVCFVQTVVRNEHARNTNMFKYLLLLCYLRYGKYTRR
jgi:hypothetical protein